MYQEYNPHPQNKLVGDCVKRALTKASGKTYQEVSNELNRIKRAHGASAYNSKIVWMTYLENMNSKYIPFPAQAGKPRMNGERFCKEFPKGVYVLRMAGHLSCCVDGIIYDTWDCSDKCVYGAHEIPQGVTSMEVPEEKVAAAPAKPKMVPMPGIEKLADLKKEYSKKTGNEIIKQMAEMTTTVVRKTKQGELWITLTESNYAHVARELASYTNFRWIESPRSKKTTIKDEKTGMTLILKSGKNPYLWCIENGN